jgi:hypothetical protein
MPSQGKETGLDCRENNAMPVSINCAQVLSFLASLDMTTVRNDYRHPF